MRILYFLAHPHSIGGAMKVLLTQAYIMKHRLNDVRVIIQNDENNYHIPEYDFLCKNMELEYSAISYPIATCIEEVDIIKCLDVYDEIVREIRLFNPDLIHSVQLNTSVELAARKLNIPHLMNIYPICEGMFNINWLNIFPDYHSCDSEYFCKQWQKGLNISSKCVRVAYEPRNTEICEHDSSRYEYELINIASFGPHKNQMEIIKFIHICINFGFDIHINFVGQNNNSYGNICKEYVINNDLNDNISFTGQVVDVEKYLLNADLMVHASLIESYPGVIVEAMANRVPIMTTPVAGIPELVKDRVNGFHINGDTAQDIFICFKNYVELRKKNLISCVIDNGFNTYLENHTYEKVGNELQDYYNIILQDWNEKKVEPKLKIHNIYCLLEPYKNVLNNVSDFTKRKIWYLLHIKEMIAKEKKNECYIWGTGKYAEYAIEWCELLGVTIKCFIDTYKTGTFLSYHIARLEECDLEDAYIIVTTGRSDASQEICNKLNAIGKIRNKDYFLLNNNPCIQISNYVSEN